MRVGGSEATKRSNLTANTASREHELLTCSDCIYVWRLFETFLIQFSATVRAFNAHIGKQTNAVYQTSNLVLNHLRELVETFQFAWKFKRRLHYPHTRRNG